MGMNDDAHLLLQMRSSSVALWCQYASSITMFAWSQAMSLVMVIYLNSFHFPLIIKFGWSFSILLSIDAGQASTISSDYC